MFINVEAAIEMISNGGSKIHSIVSPTAGEMAPPAPCPMLPSGDPNRMLNVSQLNQKWQEEEEEEEGSRR